MALLAVSPLGVSQLWHIWNPIVIHKTSHEAQCFSTQHMLSETPTKTIWAFMFVKLDYRRDVLHLFVICHTGTLRVYRVLRGNRCSLSIWKYCNSYRNNDCLSMGNYKLFLINSGGVFNNYQVTYVIFVLLFQAILIIWELLYICSRAGEMLGWCCSVWRVTEGKLIIICVENMAFFMITRR